MTLAAAYLDDAAGAVFWLAFADAVAQWAAVRDDAFASEVDALLADLFPPEEESHG